MTKLEILSDAAKWRETAAKAAKVSGEKAIAEEFLTRLREGAALGSPTPGGDAAQAVRIWTRKESLYKCSGEGVSDFLQLPPVLHDRVLFQGKPARLTSWEACGHSFSAALWGSDAPFLLNIRGEAL